MGLILGQSDAHEPTAVGVFKQNRILAQRSAKSMGPYLVGPVVVVDQHVGDALVVVEEIPVGAGIRKTIGQHFARFEIFEDQGVFFIACFVEAIAEDTMVGAVPQTRNLKKRFSFCEHINVEQDFFLLVVGASAAKYGVFFARFVSRKVFVRPVFGRYAVVVFFDTSLHLFKERLS